MHAPIRTVIFDFEGTLVDFQWRLAEAEAELRDAFAQQGYAVEGNYARMWNLAADRATAPDRIDALRRALYPVYDRWDGDALTRWSARAGAAALLQRLAERGVAAALVSNIGRTALDAALVRFGLRDRLRRVVSRDDVTRLKPDPQGVAITLAATNTPPAEALFVGDSLADVHAARAAGLRVAIIRGGEAAEADFAAAPPDWLITRLDEVAGLI